MLAIFSNDGEINPRSIRLMYSGEQVTSSASISWVRPRTFLKNRRRRPKLLLMLDLCSFTCLILHNLLVRLTGPLSTRMAVAYSDRASKNNMLIAE